MQQDHNNLAAFAALIHTERGQTRLVRAQDAVREALHNCPDMAISLSGGKDSVAAAIIARSVAPELPIVVANPPNPLPYRADHIEDCRAWFGGVWIDVDYGWNVDRVMAGREPYPARLKVSRLLSVGFSGYILGVRASESRGRAINAALRGQVYRTATGWRCLPLLRWTAEEAIGLAIALGAPVAEVYRKPLLGLPLDRVRDGTWWAHSTTPDADDWMRRNYPQCHADWLHSAGIALAGIGERF